MTTHVPASDRPPADGTLPPLSRVAVLVPPGIAPFEFGVVCEVFGIDRTARGGPDFDFHVCATRPGPGPHTVPTSLGFTLQVDEGLEAADDADLVVVPAAADHGTPPRAVLDALRRAHDRGAWVLSVCSGAFVLGHAGLLAGRRCTTHWMYADELARRFPTARVDPQVLYVEDDRVVTGAGTAAGIDACLHLVRRTRGAAAAAVIARRMVVPPHRDGGQAQYIEMPVPCCDSDSLRPVLDWLEQHLEDEVTVDDLATRALMSPRTFARRFHAEVGTTPGAWLTRQRVLRAQQLLETTELSVEEVAQRSGFGTAAVLRHHFSRLLATSPLAYRRRFACEPAALPTA